MKNSMRFLVVPALLLAGLPGIQAAVVDEASTGVQSSININILTGLIAAILIGIGAWMIMHALLGFYRTSRDRQEQRIPVRAYWLALGVGTFLTAAGILTAILSRG